MRKFILIALMLVTPSICFAQAGIVFDSASDIGTDESSFNNILSSTENDVQESLDVIDDILRTHSNSCQSIQDGRRNTRCFESATSTLYVCEPSIGLCDTPGEWKMIATGITINSFEVISPSSGSDAVADSQSDTLNIVGGTGINVNGTAEDTITIESTVVDTDTNTNATTICTGNDILQGDGDCVPTPVSGTGQAVIADIGDDSGNDSTDLGEIATTGDTNNVITVPSADKLLIDFSQNVPGADTADALSSDPSPCGANSYVTDIAADGTVTCSQPSFSNISGSATDNQIPDNITVNLATNASSLANDGTDASAGFAIRGVDAQGNAELAFDVIEPSEINTFAKLDAIVADVTLNNGDMSKATYDPDDDGLIDISDNTNLQAGTNITIVGDTISATVAAGGGSCIELDGNSDLQPVSGTCTDTFVELDGNDDLQPKS
jgi:hypothetical protein